MEKDKNNNQEKKHQHNKKENLFQKYGVLFAVFILILIFTFSFALISDLLKQEKQNEEFFQGILFYSNTKKPSLLLAQIAERKLFLISPEFTKESSYLNSQMSDAIVRFTVVLTYLGKSTIILGRVTEGNDVNYCYTNEGDVLTGKELDKNECLAYLDNNSYVKILIEKPNNKQSKIRVEEGLIEIKPKSEHDISQLSHLVLRKLFNENADLAIEASNKKAEGLIR
ncbi:MAG: hypothetical protein N3D73_01035 [Candidatus Diapherotrites archaeon]|nr:hypothetical protein [Candidatus Diapherotrites archaeon]